MSAVPEDDVLLGLIRGSLDHCVKCTICETHCPYSNATSLFPGPKYVGPQAERFRTGEEVTPDASVDYCSSCGICTKVCPQGVHIAEINTRAKARLAEPRASRCATSSSGGPTSSGALRHAGRAARELDAGQQAAAGRSREGAGHPQGRRAPEVRRARRSSAGRKRARRAAGGDEGGRLLPRLRDELLRARPRREDRRDPRAQRLQGHGPQAGLLRAAAAVQRHLPGAAGRTRSAWPSTSRRTPARARRSSASRRAARSWSSARRGRSSGSTRTPTSASSSEHTFDICEFLLDLHDRGELRTDFQPVEEVVAYHAPCQQQGHNIGKPALDLFALVPGLETVEMHAHCCGIGGTYGLKEEKRQISLDVGADLFAQVRDADPTIVGVRQRDLPLAHREGDRGHQPPPRRDPPPRLRVCSAVVAIVVVSHSAALAASVIDFAKAMGGDKAHLEPAGGVEDGIGTDFELIGAAIDARARRPATTASWSSWTSAPRCRPPRWCSSWASWTRRGAARRGAARRGRGRGGDQRGGGGSLDEVAAEAVGALRSKQAELGETSSPSASSSQGDELAATPADAEMELPVRNRSGCTPGPPRSSSRSRPATTRRCCSPTRRRAAARRPRAASPRSRCSASAAGTRCGCRRPVPTPTRCSTRSARWPTPASATGWTRTLRVHRQARRRATVLPVRQPRRPLPARCCRASPPPRLRRRPAAQDRRRAGGARGRHRGSRGGGGAARRGARPGARGPRRRPRRPRRTAAAPTRRRSSRPRARWRPTTRCSAPPGARSPRSTTTRRAPSTTPPRPSPRSTRASTTPTCASAPPTSATSAAG